MATAPSHSSMFDATDIMRILSSLLEVVDLGIIQVPLFVLLSAMLMLFGLGCKKSWLSYSGVFLIFSYYFLITMAEHGVVG